MSASTEVARRLFDAAGSGEADISDEWLARVDPGTLGEFERALLHGARSRVLMVMLLPDPVRMVTRVRWQPAGSPQWAGVWRLA